MAVIENEIQYNWVRKRVSKLKEKVDENTPSNNSYRIELELLSKLEKEYSEEHATVLEKENISDIISKTQVNIYEGLPIILEKVKSVALSAVIDKSHGWMQQKLDRFVMKGIVKEFVPSDIELINNGISLLGQEIAQCRIVYSPIREEVIEQIKNLDRFVAMPYIYDNILGKGRRWYANRMVQRKPGCSVCSFKEDDILAINMAAMQIANELKSIELVL